MQQAEKHPKIEAAAPYVTITALAEKGNKVKALEVRGVDAELESKVSSINRYVDGKAWQDFMPGKQQVILGQGVATYLGVSKGDYLTLMIPTSGSTTRVQAPKRVRVKVAGLLKLNGRLTITLQSCL